MTAITTMKANHADDALLMDTVRNLVGALELVTVALDVNDPDHEHMLTNRCSAASAIREARAAIARARDIIKS